MHAGCVALARGGHQEVDRPLRVRRHQGADTRPRFSSTSAVSNTRKHPTHPEHPLTPPNTPLTRATQPLRASPIPYKALKLSRKADECKPLPAPPRPRRSTAPAGTARRRARAPPPRRTTCAARVDMYQCAGMCGVYRYQLWRGGGDSGGRGGGGGGGGGESCQCVQIRPCIDSCGVCTAR